MRCVRFYLPLILSVLCLPQIAGAATVRVEQLWHDLGFASNGRTAESVGIFDDTSISGVGLEVAPLTYFALATYTNGVGQNFLLADFPDPPSTTVEGNIVATFHDGVFQYLAGVSNGGGARIAMTDGNSSSGAQVEGLNIAGVELIRSFSGSGYWEYRLQNTDLIYPQQPSPVPVPAAIWLFATALLVLVRRGHRTTPATAAGI
jgi:hypothetical protein